MSRPFDHFVMFAEMRTGSNFLEANLNAFASVTCHGEAFNPHFIGYPNRTEILGVTEAERNADPARLIATIRDRTEGIGGFRYFHDHDPRVFDMVVDDPRCAKIVLTRNPVDSYVSWKIAQSTGQWKLTDVRRRKEEAVEFDTAEFEAHLEALQAFQVRLMNALQRSGQTAFYVAYEDLQDVAVMNGIAQFLGIEDRLERLDQSLKRQNPAPVEEKVTNFAGMEQALARLDRFNLSRTPNFEPRRGAAVPSYVAAAEAKLMYLPVRSGPEDAVRAWMAALDGVAEDQLRDRLSQKELRQWKRRNPGHRSFTVLRHPVARINAAFCERILDTGAGSLSEIRRILRQKYKLPIPGQGPGADWDAAQHRTALMAFLDFVKANLAGQTNIRNDPSWATQAATVEGFGQFALPDMVVREEEMADWLPALAASAGVKDAPRPAILPDTGPVPLADVYDAELEAKVADVYQRDYMIFGYGPWKG
ncbi:nodulation protein NodH [Oceanicola sp. 22II-s10i]|uniref:sulfotransferase domain-containing protein n=1 Tax=Oceanicola sp. 22II-s10i TaxID=1317116 RepID=UPI000B528D54|nr:sulfotransferase domain-containing protein [Oceanicola sp. 22II-s10i]OWU86280.1 nodulation protein NodH [Oceanicola sp. 22II-s10i]